MIVRTISMIGILVLMPQFDVKWLASELAHLTHQKHSVELLSILVLEALSGAHSVFYINRDNGEYSTGITLLCLLNLWIVARCFFRKLPFRLHYSICLELRHSI